MIVGSANERYEPSTCADNVRRRAFVVANPDLTTSQRKLIEQGLIAIGMTQAMIQAAWGEPRGLLEAEVSITPNYWNSSAHGMGLMFVDGKLARVIDPSRTLGAPKE
jgi:hypothetical protein